MRLVLGQTPVDEQNTEFCANMMAESRHITNNSFIWAGVDGRDLFMEDGENLNIFLKMFRVLWGKKSTFMKKKYHKLSTYTNIKIKTTITLHAHVYVYFICLTRNLHLHYLIMLL